VTARGFVSYFRIVIVMLFLIPSAYAETAAPAFQLPTADGTVDLASFKGKVVYLDHGEGLVSAYFHLSHADVVEGQTVHAGDLIGEVGQSGRVTGPHLHWVMRYGNVSVDPMSAVALLGDTSGETPGGP